MNVIVTIMKRMMMDRHRIRRDAEIIFDGCFVERYCDCDFPSTYANMADECEDGIFDVLFAGDSRYIFHDDWWWS